MNRSSPNTTEEKPSAITVMDDHDGPPPPQSPVRTEDHVVWASDHELSPRGLDDDDDDDENQARFPTEAVEEAARLPPLPQRAEPTLKERLVERERQARVETERARLKRQFALSSNGGAVAEELDEMHASKENGSVAGTVGEGSSVWAPPTEQGNADEDDRKQLGYVMERFLSQHGDANQAEQKEEAKPKPETGVLMKRFLAEPVVVEQEVRVEEDAAVDGAVEDHEEDTKTPAEVAIVIPEPEISIHQSDDEELTSLPAVPEINATNTGDTNDVSMLEATAGSLRSYSTVTNNSLAGTNTLDADMPAEAGISTIVDDHGSGVEVVSTDPISPFQGQGSSVHSSQQSPSDEPPRVFRLTEAEIQEMAAIEEASIGNAPPSEREETFSESSSVGDLVGDLGIPRGLERVGDFSERTNTTALESNSITSVDGDRSESPSTLEMDRRSIEGIERNSVSSHLVVSPGASSEGSVSITVYPPSETAVERTPLMVGSDDNVVAGNDRDGNAMLQMPSFDDGPHEGTNNADVPIFEHEVGISGAPSFQDDGGSLDIEASGAANVGVMNRQLRPGIVHMSPRMAAAGMPPEVPNTPDNGSAMKRSVSMPENVHIMLDDFDFDRNSLEPVGGTPRSAALDSYNDLPGDDLWTSPSEMNLSPLLSNKENLSVAERVRQAGDSLAYPPLNMLAPPGDVASPDGERNIAATYGSTESQGQPAALHSRASPNHHLSLDSYDESGKNEGETQPLVRFRRRDDPTEPTHRKEGSLEIRHLLSTVFSSVRSDSTSTVEAEISESEKYLMTGFLARAFPERFFALLVTLIVEIPVLLMISGGSDQLCMLIGRRRYQLMMGFLPLSSAISGNCGLQASTLTTRAVSHSHVTKTSYCKWLGREVAAAACLGCGMGTVLGSYAYFISGMDYAFGMTIFMAQFVSIITAGLTGTLAPLIFSFIFHRDSALYGGPLETAVQDIVGSFAMVVLSYRMLLFFGPMEVEPDDVCGEQA